MSRTIFDISSSLENGNCHPEKALAKGYRLLVKFIPGAVYGVLSCGRQRCSESGTEHGAICAVLVTIADLWGRSR